MRENLRKVRGITPVVSSLLMIVIVLAAFSIVWGVTNNWITRQRWETKMQMKERLLIEDVWFRRVDDTYLITIYVRNIGKIPVTIKEVYVDGKLFEMSPSSLSLALKEGGFINVTKAGWTWSQNSTYRIKIKTERGTYVEVVSKPQS